MTRPAAPPGLTELAVAGSPRAMGLAQGEAWREAVREVCEARLEATLRYAAPRPLAATRDDLLAGMEPFLAAHRGWCPDVWDEFQGIADGAGVSTAELMIGNGYTDIRDWAALRFPDAGGCTTFTALPEATADGALYLGQTWDMDQTMLPFVFACRRRPADGPATLGITTCGCLSLIGVNEAGLAIGNSNLRPTDARPGVIYLAMIHRALAQTTLDAALEVLREAPRASGHHYYLADANRAVHLETTALEWRLQPRDGACHTHSNDYRDEQLARGMMPLDPLGRSVARRRALAEHLARQATLAPAELRAALAQPEVALYQPVLNALTCAAVILRPATGELWATHGPPAADDGWHALAL